MSSRSPAKSRARKPSAGSVAPSPAADAPLFDWLRERSAGVLLHPTSLPGDQGVGVLDDHAVRFLDWMVAAGLKHWQICPLGPTGYGDSPYQCFSAFAGNPALVDLAPLVVAGLLDAADLLPLRAAAPPQADFALLNRVKVPLLRRAAARFLARGTALPYGDYAAFKDTHAAWLGDYAYYRALKDHFEGRAWTDWPPELRDHATAQRSPLRQLLAPAIEEHAFAQYLFFGQWRMVREAARARGIAIIGDLPIFVSLDSSDAWSRPELFELDPHTRRPLAVAGVPPDYFSADGQLWGNPLYVWEAHRAEDWRWWIARLRATLDLCDVVRIDHFRGFDTYWRIPLPATDARRGEWRAGPGLELFRAFRAALPEARIIAEDLGELTPAVHDLRRRCGLPGMLVLQFAFGGDAKNAYLPHHATANSVIYPGTHDNNTTAGWYRDATERERDHVRRYLRVSGDEIAWDFIRAAYASVSRLAVIPLQDFLSLDGRARFNTPGKPDGNWRWRCTATQLASLHDGAAKYLRELAQLCDR